MNNLDDVVGVKAWIRVEPAWNFFSKRITEA